MHLRHTLLGALFIAGALAACQEPPPSGANQVDTGIATEAFAVGGLPTVTIQSPSNFAYFETSGDPEAPEYNPNHPNKSLTVTFQVSDWAYPGTGKEVWFILNGDLGVDDEDPAARTTLTDQTPVLLTNVPPGQHSLTACPYQKNDVTDAWEKVNKGVCGTIVIKISIVGCWASVLDPTTDELICDPGKPADTCCVDQNACSVDQCSYSMGEYRCKYGPVSFPCCQSDFDCDASGEFAQSCYTTHDYDPLTDDEGMVNRCYECDPFSAIGDAACTDYVNPDAATPIADVCTTDSCGADWMCSNIPKVHPSTGTPCCTQDAQCSDGDPCTIDECGDVDQASGHSYCVYRSYKDIPDSDPIWTSYDKSAFLGCCTNEKIFEYCDAHTIILDGEPQFDACWNVQCSNNQCRYGKSGDPLCCNTAAECDDCTGYDANGLCLPNLCTYDFCVDNLCTFEFNPFPPAGTDCCQYDIECDYGNPAMIYWCKDYVCQEEENTLYCNLDEGVPCTPSDHPCLVRSCDMGTFTCVETVLANCCVDATDCGDGDACTTDTCDDLTHTCEHEVIEYINGKTCCNDVNDCFDGKICTTKQCVSNQCRTGSVYVDPEECASGKCCNSDQDLDGDGSADDCESDASCNAWECVNHCCMPSADVEEGMCVTDLDCEDGDDYTWHVCDECTCLEQPPIYCDEQHPDCDDSNPCTVDTCDFGAPKPVGQGEPPSGLYLCKYTPKPACCLEQPDCMPDNPDPCTNYTCMPSLHLCQNFSIPNCCEGDDDVKCDDLDGCTADFCQNGKCRHQIISSDCCTDVSDCDDGFKCTADTCVQNECQHEVLDEAPDGAMCCTSDGMCTDSDACTLDSCINNECHNIAQDNCCTEHGTEDPICKDNNPCTSDWCLWGKCRHFPPEKSPYPSTIPVLCCPNDLWCQEHYNDGNSCTDEVCISGLCKFEPVDPCFQTLPYLQDWNNRVFPFEYLGWFREDTRGATSSLNWNYSTAGPLGLDYHLRFSGVTYPLDDFNSHLISPAFASEDPDTGEPLFTTLTVQWDHYLDLASPESTSLSLIVFENGQLVADGDIWAVTTDEDIEKETLYASYTLQTSGADVQVAFNINAKYKTQQEIIYGDAAHIKAWDIDDLHICGGERPAFSQIDESIGMFLGATETTTIIASDPQSGEALTFELVGAPDFVTLTGAGHDWYSQSYMADLVIAPEGDEALGEHVFTVRVSDGCISVDREVRVSVFIPGGYLIWVPEGVSEDHGQAIADAIYGQPDQAQAQRKWQILTDITAYPDLSITDGVFACLGVRGRSHALSDDEIIALAYFLEGGGNLYMEGGEHWYDDDPTPIETYMKITGVATGETKLDGPLTTSNFINDLGQFGYNQLPFFPTDPDNFYNAFHDHLEVTEHTAGRVVMYNDGGQSYPVVISYEDPMDGYRSIGSSIIFGGIELLASATRAALMDQYLYFFEEGYPPCDGNVDCWDGQNCTIDACDPVTHVCEIAEIPNCHYCSDDRDCDDHFGNEDYACTTQEICMDIPGHPLVSTDGARVIDMGPGTQSVISTITAVDTGPGDWKGGNVLHVEAKLSIDHAYIGDLMISLEHGNGSVMLKPNDATQFGSDYYFTHDFGRPVADGESMGDFEFMAISGDWRLLVEDMSPNNFKGGILHGWTLWITPEEEACTADSQCSDTDECTVDVCNAGFCENSPRDCADLFNGQPNLCTTDTCDSAQGCQYEQKVCDDGNDCSNDLCDPATGDCYVEWDPACASPCTEHRDCAPLQLCVDGTCDNIPGVLYESSITGSVPLEDDGVAHTFPINLGGNERMVQKVRVKVMTTHQDVSDLDVKLLYGATVFDLHADGGASAADTHWVWSVSEDGYDVPDHDLDILIGEDVSKLWTLSIQDKKPTNTGTIDGFYLFLTETYCFGDGDCDDDSTCTTDACVDNPDPDAQIRINIPKVCENIDESSGCDDGLYCNGTESCNQNAGCFDGAPPQVDDGVACTDDACDEFSDEVYNVPNHSYCNDGNPCTDDVCDPAQGGCVNVNNTVACDDGVYCTSGDVCSAGACTGTPDVTIPGCSCAGDDDCASIFNSDRCAGEYYCLSNVCQIDPSSVVDCTLDPMYFKDPCAELVCDPNDGECKAAFAEEGVVCEDGTACTYNDLCNATGQCVGVTKVCDNGYWCDGEDVCDTVSGDCVHLNAPIINDGIPCTQDICDSDEEQVYHFPRDVMCDNTIYCDGVEICHVVDGCIDGADPNCDDYNPCTVDTCDEAADDCDHSGRVAHCVWGCDGEHDYDAGDTDCGYDDACVGSVGPTSGTCAPICDGSACFTARAVLPNQAPLNLPIPDFDLVNCVTQELEVNLPGTLAFIERADARVRVEHTSLMDLQVTLTDPAGYAVRMWQHFGASNDDYANTFWLSYPDTHAPMCAFRGDAPNGTWKLKVCDGGTGNTGKLMDWTLYVKGAAADTNVGDRCDNATNVSRALPVGDGTHVLTGDTSCFQEDLTGSCGGAGKDAVYNFTLDVHKLLIADTTAGADWVLYVKQKVAGDCAAGTLKCGAAPVDLSDGAHIKVELPPGQYFMVVDSDSHYGPFQVDYSFKTLLENGGVCDHEDDCISDYCKDDTCCNILCDGLCERCDGIDTPAGLNDKGACTYIDNGLDPENECIGTDQICGGVCYYNDVTEQGGECYVPGNEVAHHDAASGFGDICERCDANGSWEHVPHGADPFGQCANRSCSGFQVYYEQRCSNDAVTQPGRVGTCDCYDTDYGVFGCQTGDPAPSHQICDDGFQCDPTDGPDDDALPDDCRTECTSQAHCQYDGPTQGWYCEERPTETDFKACKERKDLGVDCSAQDITYQYGECVLNGANPYPCVDGYCCNTSCGELCKACDGIRTTNGLPDRGTCSFLVGGSADTDAECYTSDETDCGLGWCDGAGWCDYWDGDHRCNEGLADDHAQMCGIDNNFGDLPADYCAGNGTQCETAPDWVLFPADTCDGSGFCTDKGYANCPGGLMCNATEDACLLGCVTDVDCASPHGTECNLGGGVNYYCHEGLCNPYVCDGVVDPTTNGSQAVPSASFDTEASVGGTPQGTSTCPTPPCAKAGSASYGFYPTTRAKEVPIEYPDF